ncbi:hypothetical protein [Rubinisphaera margarita]|uniref:hypothetical protein n=1 Tax=Rubinisphaera margarita TaxID=2909586 RepID=UPI001EE8D91C|nr:hypothetical protein [Rubinisphaera margarita]MCG6154460.1 hypothetical protein [Rubinisphaera margarita]
MSKLMFPLLVLSCLCAGQVLFAQVAVPGADDPAPTVLPEPEPVPSTTAPPATAVPIDDAPTNLQPPATAVDVDEVIETSESAGLFEPPEGLSMPHLVLLRRVGFGPPVAYTFDQSMLVSLACYRRGCLHDALVFAKHARTFREDAGNLYVIAYCQLALGMTDEAEVTIQDMVSAIRNGYTGGIGNYKERLNGPICIAIDAAERYYFLNAPASPAPPIYTPEF